MAVDDLSFTAAAGEVLALLGPNGAGKSTTIESLEGYRSPSAGEIAVLGRNPATEMPQLAPDLGVMLQEGGVYPSMSAADALNLFASYYAGPNSPSDLIERLGLGAVSTTPWKRLSGGEQRRLSLALAVVGRPRIAFLDEPTAGVDPEGRVQVMDLIRTLTGDGACVVLASHDLDEVERVADRVVIIDRGRLVAEGQPGKLAETADEIRFVATPGLDKTALTAALGGGVAEGPPGHYRVTGETDSRRVAQLATWLADHDVTLLELRVGQESLAETFLRLTSGRDS